MKAFLGDSFLLNSQAAERLYFDHAEQLPIYDYHCHLSPKLIADDHQFKNLAEIWLTDDHYKWRVLRTAGVDERLITGNASDEEKYWAWAEALPKALANPVYHWTHLELKRPFGITGVVFGPDSAAEIWQKANALLAKPAFSARGIMRQMNVKMVGTTDDPIDSLEYHRALVEDDPFDIQVRPSWRPDRAFKIELSGFIDYIGRLSAVSGIQITRFAELCQALSNRLDHFSSHGCVAADHGIEVLRFADVPSEGDLDRILARRLSGSTLSEKEIAQYASAVQVWLAKQYCQRRWVMQLHIGALRNNNQRMFALLGGDAGFDSIADRPIAEALSGLLNAMDINDQLPKTILYCLNPTHNEVIATMCGNFQGGGVAGKIQFGSGWWFNDQKEGMERQIMQLSQLGLLSQFVGMLTDSRSFLSYTRHEYFRRILCNRVGSWMERGEIPPDYSLVGTMIENICCYNAKGYFGLK